VRTDRYEQTTGDARLVVSAPATAMSVRRESGKKSREPSLEYLQIPGRPVSMSLGDAGARKVYQAASLWHLALADPDDFHKDLFPLLYGFFPRCRVLEIRRFIEEDLLSEAATVGDVPSPQRVTELVRQLDDDHFAKREAADRQLREFGAWWRSLSGNSIPMNSMPNSYSASGASSQRSRRALSGRSRFVLFARMAN